VGALELLADSGSTDGVAPLLSTAELEVARGRAQLLDYQATHCRGGVAVAD
jgi:hypothetical protein